jgi:signal transduction histidine kinase
LTLARTAWVTVAVLTLGIFLAGVPAELSRLQAACLAAPCAGWQLSPAGQRALLTLGLSRGTYAAYFAALDLIFAVVYGLVAAVIFWRRSNDRLALFASFALLMFGMATFPGTMSALTASNTAWRLPVALVTFLGSVSFSLFVYVFPDGHFVPGWTRWVALAWVAEQAPHYFWPHSFLDWGFWSPPLQFAAWLGFLGSMIYAQGYRYLRVSNSLQRLQTRWVVLGIALAFVGLSVGQVVLVVARHAALPTALATQLAAALIIYLYMLLIPLTIAIALLRYGLFDVDLLINRALVYGTLTACIISLYVLVVGSLSIAFQVRGNPVVALLATGVVAVVFQPLRERLQRGVNRLLYGQRDEPYTVISRLGQRLESTLAPEAVLPAIVDTVAQALKLPYVALALNEGESLRIAAASSDSVADPHDLLHLSLVYSTETVGELVLAPRAPGESFTPSDRRLLEDLAREAGIAAHAVRLTLDLQRTNGDLRRSRAQLVTMREEERRRLRRDLHDGLGSALTSMTFKLGAAENLLARDPAAVLALLEELKRETQAAMTDIRHLVYDLRPPALDELGLVSALCERAAHFQLNGVQVSVDAPQPLPALPAAVEVAAFRTALEALANVARHAQATTCVIRLSVVDGILTLEVQDNGVGLPAGYHSGVGITAMRERAAELGGTCVVEAAPSGGTRVYSQLPLLEE